VSINVTVSNFDRFLQSQSVNNVHKLLQLLGDFVYQTPSEANSPWIPRGHFPVGDFRPPSPSPWTLAP